MLLDTPREWALCGLFERVGATRTMAIGDAWSNPSFGCFYVKWSGDPGRGMESVMTTALQMTVLFLPLLSLGNPDPAGHPQT